MRQASRYARSLLEASLDPLVTISKDGKIMDVNRATESVTGVPRENLIGSDFSDYFTDPAQARAGYRQVFDRGFVRDYPLAIRHVSGSVTAVLYNATVFRDQDGQIEGVFAAARDITERKLAEAALQQSEQRYRSLALATAQVVWTTNAAGEVVSDMPTWRAFTGLTVDQIQGAGWLQSLHPDDREPTLQVWRQAVRSRSLYETEYRLRRHDGQYRHVWVRGVPVLEPDGATLREWVGTCTDVTERKLAEQALQNSAAELQRSNAELQDFAYIASHDLQEPLRKITAFGDRLRERCADSLDPAARDYLARMLNASARMAALIDGLLLYSRVSSRAQPLATVDLMQVAFEVLVDLETRIHDCGARVIIHALPRLAADRIQMRQLLQNLLGNALKFRRPGSAPVIEVGCSVVGAELALVSPEATSPHNSQLTTHKSWLELTVADNGIGFDEAYLPRLFRPFQRLHGRSEYEGSGMGLAICRKIAERHGGSITARSRPGQGSTFIVRLPAKVPGPVSVSVSASDVAPVSGPTAAAAVTANAAVTGN